MGEPLQEYETRRSAWKEKADLLEKAANRLGNARLLLAVVAILTGWFAFESKNISFWWIGLPLAGVLALFIKHVQISRTRALAERAVRYYARAIDRINDRWLGMGEPGERFRDSQHVYSDDLDLFGKGSLFDLICTARTAAGEDTLADWLLHPATFEEATARQAAVKELRSRFDLREDLALVGENVRAEVRADVITRWGARPPVLFHPALRPLAFILAVIAVISALGFLVQKVPLWALGVSLLANGVVVFLTRHQIAEVVSSVDAPANHLAVLALLIKRIEQEPFDAEYPRQLLEKLKVGGLPAAVQIQRLENLIDWLGSGSHPLMKIVQLMLLWQVQVAISIEIWRRESGPHIGEWVRALAEFEAISSLASLSFERPAWSFPELLSSAEATLFATELRHPLLSAERCIPNNVQFGRSARLLIVSGSNMSGKSTLLRTIGLNTVLAWAGGPVNAARFAVSPLETGASIRVTDSLQDNRSRFLAEITRLRKIVDLTRRPTPVLFLLDELLSGTNSHDRRIGAFYLLKGLLRSNTIGLVTTHDLALTEIAKDLEGCAENVHFEDRIENGKMEFDYLLRPGVVTHSNALELMRAVGLEIPGNE